MRQVTERDFRMPEFRDAKVEDYEFRGDGAVVRKDRWETGIHQIRAIVGPSGSFEISEVVERVEQLCGGWRKADPEDDPEDIECFIDLKLADGCVLTHCAQCDVMAWDWREGLMTFRREDWGVEVVAWRPGAPRAPKPE